MSDDQVLEEAMGTFESAVGTAGMPGESAADAGSPPPLTESSGSAGMPGEAGPGAAGTDPAAGGMPSGGTPGYAGTGSESAGGSGTGTAGAAGSATTAGPGGAAGTGTGGRGSAGRVYGELPAGTGAGSGGTPVNAREVIVLGGDAPGAGAGGDNAGRAGSGDRAVTNAERVVILEGKLEEQLAEFDGMLLEERATATASAAGNAETEEEIYATAGGSGESTAPLLTGTAEQKQSNSAGGGMPAGGGSGRQGDHRQVAMAPVPRDIPSGDDDDVVARQLREAAMKETDPELREKLWNEYRRYKGIPVNE